jgi:hypothetical protein
MFTLMTELQNDCSILCKITVCRYSETNVMHFSFSLLRIKVLYMFRALLADRQVALNKLHLVCCVLVMSVDCYQDWSGTEFHFNPGAADRYNTHAYTKYRLLSAS